jgi:hypothetical protein
MKFRCHWIKRSGGPIYDQEDHVTDEHTITTEEVHLEPVVGIRSESANKDWNEKVPHGVLTIVIKDREQFGVFKEGRCYFVTVDGASEDD